MINQRAIFVFGFLILLLLLCFWQTETIAPFAIAFIVAYLLKPFSSYLEKKFKLSRTFVATIIIGLFIIFVIMISTFLIPILYEQFSIFLKKLPTYKDVLANRVLPGLAKRLDELNPEISAKIQPHMQSAIDKIVGGAFNILNNLWHYTLSTISFFANIVLVPFILYYYIRDWEAINKSIESVVPLVYKGRYRFLKLEVNNLLESYVRGQLNICLILTVYYSTILTILQIDFALILGIVSGFLIIIPFVGFVIALSLSLIAAYVDGGGLSTYITVILSYFTGHALEVYILVPRLIGRSIGLHPVWTVFSILALGNIYGIIGIAFAIPIAGIIKILFRFALGYYRNSAIYSPSATVPRLKTDRE